MTAEETTQVFRGRPTTAYDTKPVAVNIDVGVLDELKRVKNFRFLSPLGLDDYLRMVLFGDEPPVNSGVMTGETERYSFRMPLPSWAEVRRRSSGFSSMSDVLRAILVGDESPLTSIHELIDEENPDS